MRSRAIGPSDDPIMNAQDAGDVAISELVSLAGRAAVVTGGGSGIGAAIVRRLAEAGADVVVFDDRPDDEDAVGDVASRCVADHGSLDIWVNNAGTYPNRPLLDMTAAEWDDVLDVNLRGAFLGSREAARHMCERRRGVIVNIGSTAGYRSAVPGMAHYVSSKFGLRGLTQALAVELGPFGVRVVAVAPGFTRTERSRAKFPDVSDEEYDAHLAQVGAGKPIGRVAEADDVARVVLFCVSDLAAYVTGTTIPVDGGDLAR